MIFIDDFELPPSFTRTLKDCVISMSPEMALSFAKTNPSWFCGLRLIKKQSKQLKQRIIATMFSDGNYIPEELLEFIACNDLSSDLISQLPLESLQRFLDEFLAIFDSNLFLISLLIDSREEVQKFARTAIENVREQEENSDTSPGREGKQADYKEFTDLQESVTKLKNEYAALKKESAAAVKRNKRLSKTIETLKKQLTGQQQLTTQQKETIGTLKKLTESRQTRLDDLTAELENKIQQGISAEMAATVNSWLAFPEQINTLVREDTTAPLLNRVEQALEHQAQIDKHSGNLRILKERLACLERARAAVEQSRRNSLQVLPDLALLSRELAAQIQLIHEKISSCRAENPHIASWLSVINETDSPEKLQELNHLISQLRKQDILSEQDTLILRKKVKQVRDLSIDHFQYAGKKTHPCPEKQILIVDGHNAILSDDSSFLFDDHTCALTEPEKRKLLTGISKNAFADRENISLVIFFDSPVYSETDITKNIKEIYSGGGNEEQRADNAIIHFLQTRQQKIDNTLNKIILITNDRELSLRAEKFGVTIHSVYEYGVMLRKNRAGRT